MTGSAADCGVIAGVWLFVALFSAWAWRRSLRTSPSRRVVVLSHVIAAALFVPLVWIYVAMSDSQSRGERLCNVALMLGMWPIIAFAIGALLDGRTNSTG